LDSAVKKTDEPTVIGWMLSAQVYFRDPDGHMLEFITILPDPSGSEFQWALLGLEKTDDVIGPEGGEWSYRESTRA
jgi:hypothetical protein